MATYKLRSDKVLWRLAIEKDIKPTGSGVGQAAGLPATTINQLRAGRPPKASSMAALVRLFGCTVDDLFEIVEEDVRIGA